MTKDKALKLALEALESYKGFIEDAHILEGQWHWIDGADKAITAIKQALAATVQEPDTYGYAKRLAEAIWEKHYKSTAPQWKPFEHLIGVLTQIDNMTSGLTTLPAAPVQEPVAKLQVTLQDRPIDIELAQYKRMFEAACSALGEVSEALGCDPNEGGSEPLIEAIARLKSSAYEPIAWMVYTLDGKSVFVTDNPTDFTDEHRALPLYTTPPAAPVQELEKAAAMALDAIAASGDFLFNWHDCEPNNEREMDGYSEVLALNEKAFNALRKCLLTPAAQRTWVGLTDEDIQEVRENCGITHHAIKTIEAKLREKNT